MYSRNFGEDGQYSVPDNYRGNAFREEYDKGLPEAAISENGSCEKPPDAPPVASSQAQVKGTPSSLLSSLLPIRGLPGFGSEDLLLLGILLLCRMKDAEGTETDNDITVLFLLFLLFLK